MVNLVIEIALTFACLIIGAVAYQIGWRDGWEDRKQWRIPYKYFAGTRFTNATAGKTKAPVCGDSPEALGGTDLKGGTL